MSISNTKERIFLIIRDDDRNQRAGDVFDVSVILLILLNVGLMIASTFENLPAGLRSFNHALQAASCVVFTAEYLLRLWTADLMFPKLPAWRARLRYSRSFMGLVDGLAILPFFVPHLIPFSLIELRLIRALNLLHIFGARNYVDALTAVKRALSRKARELVCSMLVVIVLIVVAALLMYSVENIAQPGAFKNAFDGLWWAVNTLSTIGFGDIVPITPLGRALSMVITVLGIMLVAVPGGIITAGFMESIDARRGDVKRYCPYCGKRVD